MANTPVVKNLTTAESLTRPQQLALVREQEEQEKQQRAQAQAREVAEERALDQEQAFFQIQQAVRLAEALAAQQMQVAEQAQQLQVQQPEQIVEQINEVVEPLIPAPVELEEVPVVADNNVDLSFLFLPMLKIEDQALLFRFSGASQPVITDPVSDDLDSVAEPVLAAESSAMPVTELFMPPLPPPPVVVATTPAISERNNNNCFSFWSSATSVQESEKTAILSTELNVPEIPLSAKDADFFKFIEENFSFDLSPKDADAISREEKASVDTSNPLLLNRI